MTYTGPTSTGANITRTGTVTLLNNINSLSTDPERADAQFNLGLLLEYGQGKGMPQHFVLAYMWFEIAAQNGILEARNNQVRLAKQMQEDQIREAKVQARRWLAKYSTAQ